MAQGILALLAYALGGGVRVAARCFRNRDRSPRLIARREFIDESGYACVEVEVRPRLFGWR